MITHREILRYVSLENVKYVPLSKNGKSNIRSLTIEDIKSGAAIMPLTQRKVWKNIQARDPVHMKLLHLINTRQLPEARQR